MEEKCKKCGFQCRCHGSFTFIEADSYIEEKFLEKCQQNVKNSTLLLEWVDSKCVYTKYTNLTASDYGNYSKHDFSHSVAILNAITSVLGKIKIDRLNVTDLWLLLHCAYGHDMGMPYSFDEMQDFWRRIKEREDPFKIFLMDCLESEDSDVKKAAEFLNSIFQKLDLEIKKNGTKECLKAGFETDWPALVHKYTAFLTSEYVRKYHAKRSGELIGACEIYNRNGCAQVESRYYKLIAKICMLHMADFTEIQELPKHEWDIETGNCHPRFTACMLRLGDLLDIDNNRFDLINLRHFGALPRESVIHKKKHEAIEHIKYTEKVIEITAKSEEEEVCQAASDWFQMLKDEVTHIVFNWTDIAPECLGGCTLSEPKTEVYWKGQLFNRVEDCEFKVDKETLIDLVIGRNLYKAQFDFLKEYIQNAMDAAKMKFWIEIQDGNVDFFIKNQEKVKQKKRYELMPFELDSIAFRQYAIDIICIYIDKMDAPSGEDSIRIEILDRGIGIDKECITAISNIGSGWSRRKRYTKYLENMPQWLKPTGGFGIGMQSGFMIANEIHIETRCEDDSQGRRISLYSNKHNGRIEERGCPVRHVGTKVIVDVPYKWFMDGENYKEYPELKFDLKEIDYFDSTRMMKYITEFVKKYVSAVLGNPLFPVYVKQKDCMPEGISNFNDCAFTEGDLFVWHEEEYLIHTDDRQVYIWEKRREILCRIIPADHVETARKANWYFKGVRVWTEREKEGQVPEIYEYIGNFDIDIMGMAVHKCLTIDRNRFINNFEYIKIANDFAIIYLNYMAETDAFIKGAISGNILLNCILAYKYVDSMNRRGHIRNYIDNFSSEEIREFITHADLLMYRNEIEKGKKFVREIDTIFRMCRDLWFNDEIYWAVDKVDFEANYDWDLLLEKNQKVNVWEVSDEPANTIGARLGKLLEKNFQNVCIKYVTETGNIFYYQGIGKVSSMQEDKEKIFLLQSGRRQIFYTNEYYPQLYVSRIPFDMEDSVALAKKAEKSMIISPIPAMFADQDFPLRLRDKESPDEEYLKLVTENKMYEQLLDWVYTYQVVPEKYSKEDINHAYKTLLQYIFENNFKKLIYEGESEK